MSRKRERFDIKAHLKNHAFYFKQYKEIEKDDLHFNVSFLDIQFFDKNENAEEILFKLLQELLKIAKYKVKNGYYIDKNGNKRQKYTTRVINLANIVKVIAIHIAGADGEYVMPHFHFILDKNARLGKNFSLLMQHINEVSKKFNLKPNFAEISQNNPHSYKNLQKSVKNFSWIVRKMTNQDFKKYVETKLSDKLDKLTEYTLLSNNLQYYIKTLEFIKKRLNRQRIDFIYKNHNLRNTYPIPLTNDDMQVIKLINEKKFSQKDIKSYLNNAILRDFVRYSYFKDKSKALIINSLSKQTELLQNLRPNKRIVENYLKLYKKTLDLDKKQLLEEQEKEKEIKSIKEILKEDLIKVSQTCKNEKELRAGMQKLGYKEFGFKKKSGKIYAYQFKLKDNDKKIIVKCADSIDIKKIRAILKENWIKSKKNEAIKSDLSDERSQIATYTLPKALEASTASKVVEINYKTEEIEKQKEKQKEKVKERREYERDYQRIRELIEASKRNATTIKFDTSRELTAKKAVRELSERELSTKSESSNIRREAESFRNRIKSRFIEFARSSFRAINEKFSEFRNEFTRKIEKLVKNRKFLEADFSFIKKIRKNKYKNNNNYLSR